MKKVTTPIFKARAAKLARAAAPRLARFGWAASPLLPLLIVTWVSCYLLPVTREQAGPPRTGGEFFPLSSFPMYSSNGEKTYMVYLTDGDGNPIAAQKVFGVRTSSLKKDYDRELSKLGGSTYDKTVEEKEPAGRSTLEYLVRDRAADRARDSGLKAVQLVDMRIYRREGRLVKESEVVARVEIEP